MESRNRTLIMNDKILESNLSSSKTHDEQRLKITVTDHNIKDWLLSLCLLQLQKINKLVLLNSSTKLKLVITTNPKSNEIFGKAKTIKSSINYVCSSRELATIINFYMDYYRDGIADVDHIDFELEIIDGPEHLTKTMFLTFAVENAKPSLSAKEALKILNSQL